MVQRIPKDFINNLRQDVDITELIGNRLEIKPAGNEYRAICPFHNDKKPSLCIIPQKGFYYCFSCQATGDAISFLMEYENLDYVEAIEEIAKMLGRSVPRKKENIAIAKERNRLKELLVKISSHYEKNLKNSDSPVDYLKNRGIDGETAKHFALGFASNSWDDVLNKFGTKEEDKKLLLSCGVLKQKDKRYYDAFRNRIMFPIRTTQGETVGFGGRKFDDKQKIEAKYINSSEALLFKKRELLYGLYESKKSIAKQKKAIIVEGFTDVITLHQNKIRYALATMGVATTETHIYKIFKISDQIIFCFDGDNAGKKAAERAMKRCLPLVRNNKDVSFLLLEDDDPDEFIKKNGAKAFEKLIENAESMDDFLIKLCNQESDISTTKGKANAAENAMIMANTIRDGIYKDLVIKKISKEYGLSEEKLVQYHTRKPPKVKAKAVSQTNRPSLMNQAIRTLLNKPELGRSIDIKNQFKFIDVDGINIFREIIQLINKIDNIIPATIIGNFSDRPKLKKYLNKLALEEPLINEDDWTIEFEDIKNRLEIQDQRKELMNLTKKAKKNNLNKNDERRLKELSRKIK